MDISLFLKIFIGLFAIMNPLAVLPLFVNVTRRKTNDEKIKIAFISAVAICISLLVVAASGKAILSLFGITLAAFRVAGGIIIFLIAYFMLHSSNENSGAENNEEYSNPAIVPIAIPMMVGAGTISKIIAFSSKVNTIADYMTIFSAIVASSILAFIIFTAGSAVIKALGKTGLSVITGVMAILLAAIAAEMFLEGIHSFFMK